MVVRRVRYGRRGSGRGGRRVRARAPGRVDHRGPVARAPVRPLRVRGHLPGRRGRVRRALPDAAASARHGLARHRRPAHVPPVRAEPGDPPGQCAAARRPHAAAAAADERDVRGPRGVRREAGRAPRAAPPPRRPRVGPRARHHRPGRRAQHGRAVARVRAAARGRGPGRVVRPVRRGGEAGVDGRRPLHRRHARHGAGRVPEHPARRDRADEDQPGKPAQLAVLRRRPAAGTARGLPGRRRGVPPR